MTGIRLALSRRVLPLVAVAGAECIDALVGAGFTLTARSSDGATLTKGARVVLVPDVAMLTPEQLLGVLQAAGVPYGEFLDLLSEAPTDPAISRTRLSSSAASR